MEEAVHCVNSQGSPGLDHGLLQALSEYIYKVVSNAGLFRFAQCEGVTFQLSTFLGSHILGITHDELGILGICGLLPQQTQGDLLLDG